MTVAAAAALAIAGTIVFVANIATERDRADAALAISEQAAARRAAAAARRAGQ